MSGYTVQARELGLLVMTAQAMGVPPVEMLAKAGLAPDALSDGDARIPLSSAITLWELASVASGRPAFGIDLARRLPVGQLDLLDYVSRHSNTLGESYAQVVRYQRIGFDGDSLSIHVDGAHAIIRHVLRDGTVLPRHLMEFLMGMFVVRGRALVGDDLTPRAARFRHARPDDVAPLVALFGARLEFEAEASELEFAATDFARPVIDPDPMLRSVIERHARAVVATITSPDDLPGRVRASIAEALPRGVPTAGEIARRLALSERTLHRKLADEGRKFGDLIDGVRRDLALAAMRDASQTLTDIAFALGFEEVSSFHRAFKRWTGSTPAAYRRGGVT